MGIQAKAGRYGGTYAHLDIAFEFASWISPEFNLYIFQYYQRFKQEEAYKIRSNGKLTAIFQKSITQFIQMLSRNT